MRVSLSPNFRQNKNISVSKNITNTNYINKTRPKDSISFGAVDPFTLIYLVAKYGVSEGLKGGFKINKFLSLRKGFANVIEYPKSHMSELVDTLFALSKTPSKMEEEIQKNAFLYEWVAEFKGMSSGNGIYSCDLRNLKNMALDKIFPLVDDTVAANREAKKALMSNICDEGHYDYVDCFLNAFKNLPNLLYKGFKEQIIDKCLYSPECKKAMLSHSSLEHWCFENMDLVETLDEKVYSDYIRRNQSEITRQKQVLFQQAKEVLMDYTGRDDELWKKVYRNKVYEKYKEGFSGYWGKKYQEPVLRAMIEECGFDKAKVAKLFNIDEDKAAEIIRDMKKQK